MWAILSRSFPISFSLCWFNKGQPKICSTEREVGRPCFGKHWSLSQDQIVKLWREVRCWNPLPFSDFKFGKLEMLKLVRVGGSNASSGKDSNSSHLLQIMKSLREWRACDPHSLWQELSFSKYWIVSVFKLEGKPSLGNESNSGHVQLQRWKRWEEGDHSFG